MIRFAVILVRLDIKKQNLESHRESMGRVRFGNKIRPVTALLTTYRMRKKPKLGYEHK